MNKFTGAPGSITDLASGGSTYPLVYPLGSDKTKVGRVSPDSVNEKGAVNEKSLKKSEKKTGKDKGKEESAKESAKEPA